MNKSYHPIKRSRQLSGLSRDHHDTLLFVWKIKQGIIYGISADRIARYCEWFWTTHLKSHFRMEEEGLSKILPSSDPLLNTMFDDHEAIKLKIEQAIDDPSYYSLKRLAQIIYYHIRFEERSLFTHVEEAVPAESLEEAMLFLGHRDIKKTEWPDEFWIKPRHQQPSPEKTNQPLNQHQLLSI